MITIKIEEGSLVEKYLEKSCENIPSVVKDYFAVGFASKEVKDELPILDIGRDEVSFDEVEEVFGFSEISSSNAPIGLPIDIKKLKICDDEILLFSIKEFQEYLRELPVKNKYESTKFDSFDDFLEIYGDEMSGRDFLISAVLELTEFSLENQLCLTVRW